MYKRLHNNSVIYFSYAKNHIALISYIKDHIIITTTITGKKKNLFRSYILSKSNSKFSRYQYDLSGLRFISSELLTGELVQ